MEIMATIIIALLTLIAVFLGGIHFVLLEIRTELRLLNRRGTSLNPPRG